MPTLRPTPPCTPPSAAVVARARLTRALEDAENSRKLKASRLAQSQYENPAVLEEPKVVPAAKAMPGSASSGSASAGSAARPPEQFQQAATHVQMKARQPIPPGPIQPQPLSGEHQPQSGEPAVSAAPVPQPLSGEPQPKSGEPGSSAAPVPQPVTGDPAADHNAPWRRQARIEALTTISRGLQSLLRLEGIIDMPK